MKGIYLAIAAILFLSTCKPSECLVSVGNIQKQARTLGFFDKMIVEDNISVELIEGEAVWVETGENLLPLIETTLQADCTLVLSNKAKCNWLRSYQTPIRVYVGAKNLGAIRWESYGNLEAKNQVQLGHLQIDVLNVNPTFKLDVNAAGLYIFSNLGAAMDFSGKTNFFSVFTMGYGKINALALQAQNVSIRHQGQNDIWVNASQSLEATLESSGNLFYKSATNISKNIQLRATGKAFSVL
jgi:hypothetical protein